MVNEALDTPNTAAELVEARTLSGFRDLLPGLSMQKSQMLAKLRAVFESFGYVPIETPHLEHADVLIGKAGSEIGKQIYRFRDHGERDVALRFDLTVPLARFVVQHKNELGLPFKRYAIGEVFRGEKAQAGRFREFTQCDFDFIGSTSPSADAEIVQVIAASMQALGIADFTIRINNRKVMNGLIESIDASEKAADVLRIVDKLDKIGTADVREALAKESGLSAQQIEALMTFIGLSSQGDQCTLLERAKSYSTLNENLAAGFMELDRTLAVLKGLDLPTSNYRVDFSVVRGLGYYTGIVFETILNKLPHFGSVCGGGRYDNLTKSFSSDHLPGVGASVGLDRLIAALEQLGLSEVKATPAKVLFTQLSDELTPLVHRSAQAVRQAGINVEVFPECAKLRKQFEYANRKGHAFAVTIGPDEAKKGTLQLKNLARGEQQEVGSLDNLLKLLVTA